jgi:heme iron utilization protein
MDRAALAAIRDLLTTTRVLSLAVVVDGGAEAALLPYAVRPGCGAVWVQASGLARHARGLTPGARVGVLVHAPDTADADPMQLRRLMMQATVHVLVRDSHEFTAAAERFTERFPGARMTLDLPDFVLYELTFDRGRYVEGFARAFNVGPQTLQDVATL